MGTRADFYLGEGKQAEWLGSIAWDGYEWSERKLGDNPDCILRAKTEDEYREAVAVMLAIRSGATLPHQGWPWPWDDSKTTDYAYCFVDGEIKVFSFGCAAIERDNTEEDGGWLWSETKSEWPDMTAVKIVALSGERSGIIVIGN
jgi:hypothetical protein